MAEQTFKSPGFFEREIEVISRPIFRNTATPAGLIGPAERGPAFVPTTVSSIEEYTRIFGSPDRRMLGGHAATEFFRNNGKALTFCRTLGSGYWSGSESSNAGFKLSSDNANGTGSVFFMTAIHALNNVEHHAVGMFNDNNSFSTNDNDVKLVRAMIFARKDVYLKVEAQDFGGVGTDTTFDINIKLSADNSNFKTLTVSLDPSHPYYISKVINTDPHAFDEHKVLLYVYFPVDEEFASTASKKSSFCKRR
jgi:hypothetical protein